MRSGTYAQSYPQANINKQGHRLASGSTGPLHCRKSFAALLALSHFRRLPLLTIIHDAGWPIWFLLATSILGLALIVDRLLALRRSRVMPTGLFQEVAEMLRHQQDTPDSLTRLEDGSPFGRVMAETIRQRHLPSTEQRQAIEDIGRIIAHQLSRSLSALGTVAVIAPLLGLFGTVVGMIEIFASYSPTGGDPSQLARGISVALYNTGFGILIAVPALIFHRHFRARVDAYMHEMEHASARLLRLLATRTESSR